MESSFPSQANTQWTYKDALNLTAAGPCRFIRTSLLRDHHIVEGLWPIKFLAKETRNGNLRIVILLGNLPLLVIELRLANHLYLFPLHALDLP